MAEPEGNNPTIKIIEHCQVSPPINSAPTSSLPLTSLDIPWMFGSFVQHVLFYEFPHSKSNPDLVRTILPSLKSSLSLALENFYPLAAKIVVPPLPNKPQIVYNEGEDHYVPFTVAESMANFHELISNDPQDVKLLHPLVPQIAPPWRMSEEGICTITPLLAIQVTLFPNSGMCLGVRYNHTVCDGMSFLYFLKSWASICRTGDLQGPVPFLGRGIIEDPNDLQTAFSKVWWSVASRDPNPGAPLCLTDQRATFILSKSTINRLKIWISNQSTMMINITSFAAVCAFTWVCVVKSTTGGQVLLGDKDDDKHKPQLRHFVFHVDCRKRLEAPLPDETYFGNCIMPRFVAMEEKMLLGRDGIVLAAMAIARKVKEIENNGGVLKGVERFISDWFDANQSGVPLTVAGSPRLAVYDTDFGWGRPKKSAVVHIDVTGSISLAESRDEEGGMEIGVALSKTSMDAFITSFNQLDSFVV